MGWCADHGLPHSALYEWEDEDRAKLHAYLLEESLRCTMCGTAKWEWEANKHAYTPEDDFCQGCYLKAKQAEDNDSLDGTTVILIPNTPEVQEKRRVAHLRTMDEKRRQREEEAAEALEGD